MSYFAVKSVSLNGRISFDIIGNKMYEFTQVGFGEHNFYFACRIGSKRTIQNNECKQQQLAVSCSVVSIIMKNTMI